MVDYFSKRPMLLCALISSLISVIGHYYPMAAVLFGSIFVAGFIVLVCIKFFSPYAAVFFILILISIRLIVTDDKIKEVSSLGGHTVYGDFTVVESPENHGVFYTSVIEVQACGEIESGNKILLYTSNCAFECGDVFSGEISLKSIKDKYKLSNYSQGIYLTGNIKEITAENKGGDFVLSKVNKLRKFISDILFVNMDYKEAATLNAIIYGDSSKISSDFNNCIKGAGISHVMVVSGMHLAIIVRLVSGSVEKLWRNRYLKFFTIFLTVLFMIGLCGLTKSIIRAGLCYFIYSIAMLNRRANNSENSLGFAISIILAIDPLTIFSISFQLSVLSTLGIVTVALPINKYIKEKPLLRNKTLIGLVAAANITLAALLFTLPVTTYIFGYISIVSVPANMLISFAMTAALSISAVGLVFYAVSPLVGSILMTTAGFITEYINYIIELFGGQTFSTLGLGKGAFIFSVILLISVIILLFSAKKREERSVLFSLNRKIIKESGKKVKRK